MPPLVGDLIVRARNAANDPCQTLNQPIAPAGAPSGAGIFTGHIFGFITYLTLWGEATPSIEVDCGTPAAQGIALTAMAPPLAAIAGRFYYGIGSGNEQQFITFTPAASVVVGATGALALSGVAPYKSSAYLPDTDGDIVSASDIYRWINAGLVRLGRLAGGILDQTGVAMPAGNAEVVIPGWWLRFTAIWHNGWLTLPEQQNYTWLQSPVQGIPGIVTLWRNGAQQVLGTWPQPSQAPAATTLSAPMAAGDTAAAIVSGSGFTAPGMCQIDQEIMSYSTSTATGLTGIVRGYSGTIAAAHLANAAVSQLILRLLGRRMPVAVIVGQSANVLDLPQGWDEVMDLYLASKFKQTEQDDAAAKSLMTDFDAAGLKLQDNQIPLESKQVGGLYPLGGAANTLAEINDTVIVE